MFEGNAEAAMNLYVSLFPGSEVIKVLRHDDGKIMHATFSLNGQQFMCIDSSVSHGFTFTPATSIYVNCETDTEIEHVFNTLSDSGKVLMPLGTYPFSKKYAWLTDKFGVSWQLSFNV